MDSLILGLANKPVKLTPNGNNKVPALYITDATGSITVKVPSLPFSGKFELFGYCPISFKIDKLKCQKMTYSLKKSAGKIFHVNLNLETYSWEKRDSTKRYFWSYPNYWRCGRGRGR